MKKTILILALGVLAATSGSAANVNLGWTNPTENEDGSPLKDLGGAKVYWGTASSNYTKSVDVGLTNRFTLTGLDEGTRYFMAGTAYNANGVESTLCQEIQVVTPDLTPPTITGPDKLNLKADGKTILLPDIAALCVAYDNITPVDRLVFGQTPVAGAMLGVGDYPVTVTVQDEAGNVGQLIVDVKITPRKPNAPSGFRHDNGMKFNSDGGTQ